jgi:hypothetical protein
VKVKHPDLSDNHVFDLCITQPTFLPWVGWFDIADQCRQLVLLDDAQFVPRSWHHRNLIRRGAGADWLTIPVKTSGRRGQPILSVELAEPDKTAASLIGKIRESYAKCDGFGESVSVAIGIIESGCQEGRLVSVTVPLISFLLKELGIKNEIIFSSSLGVNGARGERLANICAALGAKTYLSTAGAREYLTSEVHEFDKRGVTVWLHEYQHPTYHQRGADAFIPHLSVLDLLANVTSLPLEVIRSGRRPASMVAR